MALKFFTGKLHNNYVAVNPDLVIYVAQHKDGHAVINTMQSGSIEVTEKYLDVVARLNERD